MRLRLPSPLSGVPAVLVVVIAVLVLAGATGCAPAEEEAPPTADGGWLGTYSCGNNTEKVSLVIDESDAELAGEGFVDFTVTFLTVPLRLTGRSTLDGSNDDGDLSGGLDVIDNAQGIPDFGFSLSLNKDADELDGEIDPLDGEGQPAQTCEAHLELVDVRDVPDA